MGAPRYIARTVGVGLTFGGPNGGFEGYCDADSAGDLDTMRSTTGYVFILHGGAISWSSRRQPTVAASTTEAEYMAAAYAVKEALWLRTLLKDLDLECGAVIINGDKQGALKCFESNHLFAEQAHQCDLSLCAGACGQEGGEVRVCGHGEHEGGYITKPLAPIKHARCCDGIVVKRNA